MREQDRGDAIYDAFNTIENVQEIWEYLLTDDFTYVMEQVLDDPVPNVDIIVTLVDIVKDFVRQPEVQAKLDKAFQDAYPDWFDKMVDKEIRRRAGLDD